MKAKLIVEGKEFEVDVSNAELRKLYETNKKTGYERAAIGERYYFCGDDYVESEVNIYHDSWACNIEDVEEFEQTHYDNANYYSSKIVAENNIRADKLMRQLRRFAVEHKKEDLNWYCTTGNTGKYYIYYDYSGDALCVYHTIWNRHLFGIYFDSEADAKAAIETFHDELIWYFTEYTDSL